MASSLPKTTEDVENQSAAEEYLEGIAECSAYIGSDGDLALFRRFDTLGARNLLHYQLELLALEEQLHELDEEDKQFVNKNSTHDSNGKLQPNGAAWEVLIPAKDWMSFVKRASMEDNRLWDQDQFDAGERSSQDPKKRRSIQVSDARQQRKMVTVMRIREVLKDYRE